MLFPMRLQRLFTHRLVRILRLVLPVVVVVLIGITAWSYWTRLRDKPAPAQKPEPLPKELVLKTDDFNFSKTEGNRTLFTIHAKTNLGTSDEKNMLQEVDLTIFGDKDGDPPRSVRSHSCAYDQKTENIVCTGDVHVQLDEHTTAQTEEILYSHAEGIVNTTKPTAFAREGSIHGTAATLHYTMATGLLQLRGAVKIQSPQGLDLQSGSAIFNDKENWATASDGVVVKTATGWVRGRNARAELTPISHEPKAITVEGGVSSESKNPKDGSQWNVQAEAMRVDFADSHLARRILASLNVEAKKMSREENLVIRGDEVEALMNAAGDVDIVEARQNARMDFGPDRYLTANQIWTNPAGGVSTQGPSILHAADAQITGTDFNIQNGVTITFNTDKRAVMTSNDRQTSANHTSAQFDSKTSKLVSLVQTGRFTFTEGPQSGQADSARLEDSFQVIRLEGAARVRDAKSQVEAGMIELNDRSKTQTASTNVRSISTDSGERVLVTADRVERTADKIVYSGRVRFYRGSASIEADRLEAPAADKTFRAVASGHVFSSMNNVQVWADRLNYDDAAKLAQYSGSVRGQKKDMRIVSDEMVVKTTDKDKGVSEITAKGNVVVTRGAGRGVGDQAFYDAVAQRVILTGPNAEVQTGDGNFTRAPSITISLAGDRMAVVEGAGTKRAVTRYQVPPQ